MFSSASPSTSAIADSAIWIQRLMRAFGSPNQCGSMELCGWGRIVATKFTFGVGMGVRGDPDAGPGARRLHPVLGLQPEPRPDRPRDDRVGGAQARRAADRGRSPPRRAGEQGGPVAARAPGQRRRARPRDRPRHDRARLVRSRLRPRLDERPAARPGGHRAPAHRARPLHRGQREASTSPGTTPPGGRSSTIRPPAATRETVPSPPSSASTRSAPRRATWSCRTAFELVRRAVPALSPGRGRVDLLASPADQVARGGPAALGGAAGRLLRLERRRAADQRHPDLPRHRAALRAHRQLRRAGR